MKVTKKIKKTTTITIDSERLKKIVASLQTCCWAFELNSETNHFEIAGRTLENRNEYDAFDRSIIMLGRMYRKLQEVSDFMENTEVEEIMNVEI